VEREALQTIQQLNNNYVQHIGTLEQQLIVPEPDIRLMADDPDLYVTQLEQHRYSLAQRQQVQQAIANARQQAEFAQREMFAREQAETAQVLAQTFPEYLDATSGPKLREELGSTALQLGYTAEQLANVDHRDILAMRTAHDWRQKAEKYDALMSKKMATVRAARGLPRVSRPGVPQGKGAAESQRYAQDRQAMRDGDRDAAVRVFKRFT
jgi:hypothetical protein